MNDYRVWKHNTENGNEIYYAIPDEDIQQQNGDDTNE